MTIRTLDIRNCDMPAAPDLLVVDDDPAHRAVADAVSRDAGWQIDCVGTGGAAAELAKRGRYALILIDIDTAAIDGFGIAATIRSGGGASAAAAILGLTAPSGTIATARIRGSGLDGHIAKPLDGGTMRSAIERWRPSDAPAPTARLAWIFGAVQIDALLAGLRCQLEEALAYDGARPYPGAHRLVGIAGTLGFHEVSRQWLAVSEGDATALAEARIGARKALFEIAVNHR